MENIFEKVWVYCGHESQIPNAGDYYALTIGRQPMIMVRAADRSIHVLHNRCPHRGVQLVGNLKGNTGGAFVCSYHAWSFHLDGEVRAIPLARGYEGTAMNKSNPTATSSAPRGSTATAASSSPASPPTGPTLSEFLGDAKIAFDDMCDRSPLGEVEVVPLLPPHGAAVELEVLHGEPARRAAPFGHPPVDRHLRRPGGKAPQGEGRRGAAALPLPLHLRLELRAVGQPCRPSISRAATASSRPTWACARRTPTRSSTRRC